MKIICPEHGKQFAVGLSPSLESSVTSSKPQLIEQIIFLIDNEIWFSHFKSIDEKWDWMRTEMSEDYMNRYFDEYLARPGSVCKICFDNYLNLHRIQPQIIKVHTKD